MSESLPLELPAYRSHKVVHALKISELRRVPGPTDSRLTLVPEDERFEPLEVSNEWVRKHTPNAPGYYVVYEDGYTSWSPAAAFEGGYTLIEEQTESEQPN